MDIRVPFRFLVPIDIVDHVADPEIALQTSAVVTVSGDRDAPTLSDRIVTIQGTAEQQEAACHEVLCRLRAEQGADDGDEALFVGLVPPAAAPAIIGARGAKIQELIDKSGAEIEVSREVIPGLQAQPVTATGTLEQIELAMLQIHELLQRLAEGGRLAPSDFGLRHFWTSDGGGDHESQENGENSGQLVDEECADNSHGDSVVQGVEDEEKKNCFLRELAQAGVEVGATGARGVGRRGGGRGARGLARGRGALAGGAVTPPPVGISCASSIRAPCAPVQFLVGIDVAGWIIGKQGRNIAELQQRTGARITISGSNSNLPGMRVGDRLVEVSGESEEELDDALRALYATAADAPDRGGGGGFALLVPGDAVGYVIGKGGQTIKDIMERSGVTIDIDRDGRLDSHIARISGPSPEVQADAAIAVVAKVEELRNRHNTSSMHGYSDRHSDPGSAYGASIQGPRSGASTPPTAWSTTVPSGRSTPPGAGSFGLGGSSPLERELGALGGQTMTSKMSSGERAFLAGIHASGILDHRLTMRIPHGVVRYLEDIALASGARLETGAADVGGADPGHLFVTACGTRIATSLAALHIQEAMLRGLTR